MLSASLVCDRSGQGQVDVGDVDIELNGGQLIFAAAKVLQKHCSPKQPFSPLNRSRSRKLTWGAVASDLTRAVYSA